MTVIGLQDFVSATIARQTTPATLSQSVNNSPSSDSTQQASSTQNDALLTNLSNQALDSASLTNSSADIAQYSTILQIAQDGVAGVKSLLQQLEVLVGQTISDLPPDDQPSPNTPSGTPQVSSASLSSIDSQYQQILAQINSIATSTTFGGASILDGTYNGQQTSAAASVSGTPSASVTLPDLTTNSLFGGSQPATLSADVASQVLSLVSSIQNNLDQSSSDISEAQNQLEYAAASLQSAISNVDASQSTLTDSDISGILNNLLGSLSSQPASAAQIQTANLSSNLVNLLND